MTAEEAMGKANSAYRTMSREERVFDDCVGVARTRRVNEMARVAYAGKSISIARGGRIQAFAERLEMARAR